jgi:hypothetical protein
VNLFAAGLRRGITQEQQRDGQSTTHDGTPPVVCKPAGGTGRFMT